MRFSRVCLGLSLGLRRSNIRATTWTPGAVAILVGPSRRRWSSRQIELSHHSTGSNSFDPCSRVERHQIIPEPVKSSIKFKAPEERMKYILVTGGVISGIGKGVIASSIGTILKAFGLQVTSIKIDPYINIDAGTFSPYEHGEVYVLDDGGEVDLDLGNYERFLDIKLHRDNNITTGKIYQHVINKERKGDYLGKTVQVVPHITDAIQEWVERVAKVPVAFNLEPEICIIELGGTIGDIEGMPFVEAFRQFQFRIKKDNFCCVHVSLVPQPRSTGEQKTKPTQASVRELRGLGLSPDLIVCRSEKPITEGVRDKISNFCDVTPEQVICIHDVPSIYHVPLIMEDQNVVGLITQQLGVELPAPGRLMAKWRDLAEKSDAMTKEVVVALVGKYTMLEDAYASVTKALQHAALACNLKLNLKFIEAANLEPQTKETDPVQYHEAWQSLCKSEGVLVPGGFGTRGIEGKIAACEWARKNKKPLLGVCLGFQCAVIEFARNVVGWKDAQSTEFNQHTIRPVVIDMPEHNPGNMGGTMRLGKRETCFKTEDSILRRLYKNVPTIEERHRHRYEVNPAFVPDIEAAGMKFVGQDVKAERMEIMELDGHPFYVGVQFHPEYISRPLTPSPPYLGLILASSGKLNAYLNRGCRFSPRYAASEEETSDGDSSGFTSGGETAANGKATSSSTGTTLPSSSSTLLLKGKAKDDNIPLSSTTTTNTSATAAADTNPNLDVTTPVTTETTTFRKSGGET